MQYEIIKINESGAAAPYTSIEDYIERNGCEHMAHARQTGVRILGIAESYNTNTDRILTDKGYLFVKITNDIYHLYHLFAEPSALNYGHVLIINEPLDTHNVSYENTHRIVLYKEAYEDLNAGGAIKYRYYADGIKYGHDGQKNIYRLDTDGYIKPNKSGIATIYYPEKDGYYHADHEVVGVRYFLISYKQYVYLHLNPSENITIKLVNMDGTEISSKLYSFDDTNYYIDNESTISGEVISDPDEGLDITPKTNYERDDNQYMCIALFGNNASAPEQVLMEVC